MEIFKLKASILSIYLYTVQCILYSVHCAYKNFTSSENAKIPF